MKRVIVSSCEGIEFALEYERQEPFQADEGIPATQVVRAILTHQKLKDQRGNNSPEPEGR